MFLPLGIIVGLLMAVAWVAKRLRQGRFTRAALSRPAIEILASRPMGLHASLLIIEAEGQLFLIGAGRNGIQRIGRLGTPRPAEPTDFFSGSGKTQP